MATTNGIPDGHGPNIPIRSQFNVCRTVSGSPVAVDADPVDEVDDLARLVNCRGLETLLVSVEVTGGTSATVGLVLYDEGATELDSGLGAGEVHSAQLSTTSTVTTAGRTQLIEFDVHGLRAFPIVTAVDNTGSDVTKVVFRIAAGKPLRIGEV